MNRLGAFWILSFVTLQSAACNVETTNVSTGGLSETAGAGGAQSEGSEAGAAGEAAGAAGVAAQAEARSCPEGTAVVLTDWVSTQVALSSLEGETLSKSFISTASSEASGLAFTLSGDVILPSTPPASERVVLLDRFGTNVVTWVDPASADILGQLAIGTGFESNPSDYLELDEGVAWVSRWGQNTDPGQEDFDRGGDILIVDTENYEITGSIEIEPEDDLPPRPGKMTRVGDEVILALERVSEDFSAWGEARLVGISVEEQSVSWQLELSGLKNCGSPVPFPGGEQWLVACAGVMTWDGAIEDVAQSGLVILDPSDSPPSEVERIEAEGIAGEMIQAQVALASETLVLAKTNTGAGAERSNRWIAFDLESRETTMLLEASPNDDGSGKGLVYGGLLCAPGCSDICLLADGDQGVLQRVRVDGAELELLEPIVVEESVGLPPMGLAYR